MKRLFYFVATVLLACGPLPVARATNSDPSNVASTRPNEDEDQDGLTNQEEAEMGTFPYNAYSDADSVKDGEDGWALDPDLHPPRIPNESYAIINLTELGFINPVALNNHCDILDGTDYTARFWSNGQFTPIPQPVSVPPSNPPNYQSYWNYALSDSGTVTTWITHKNNSGETVVSTWSASSGLGTLDYYAPGFPDGENEFNSPSATKITPQGSVLGSTWGSLETTNPTRWRGFYGGIRWAAGSATAVPVGDMITYEYNFETGNREHTSGTEVQPSDENANGVIVGWGRRYTFTGGENATNAVVCNNGTVTFLANVAAVNGSSAYSINTATEPLIVGVGENYQPYCWILGGSGITGKRLAYFDPLSDSLKNAPSSAYQVNDRFEVSGYFGLIQNGALVDWKKKLPGYSSFYIGKINNKGCALGVGYPDGSGVAQKLLLLPVSLKDIKKLGDADDIALESIPPKKAGESENAYIQRPLKDKQIAYIEPHGAADGIAPEMPHLVAKIPGGPAGLKVKWKLIVEYKRGNGYRPSYVSDFTRPEDTVRIPASGNYTAEMNADQEWRIFESEDWNNELAGNGFFGGTAKLYVWFTAQLVGPPKAEQV